MIILKRILWVGMVFVICIFIFTGSIAFRIIDTLKLLLEILTKAKSWDDIIGFINLRINDLR